MYAMVASSGLNNFILSRWSVVTTKNAVTSQETAMLLQLALVSTPIIHSKVHKRLKGKSSQSVHNMVHNPGPRNERYRWCPEVYVSWSSWTRFLDVWLLKPFTRVAGLSFQSSCPVPFGAVFHAFQQPVASCRSCHFTHSHFHTTTKHKGNVTWNENHGGRWSKIPYHLSRALCAAEISYTNLGIILWR